MKLLYKKESFIIRGIAFDIYKQFRNNHKEKIYHNAYFLGLTNNGLTVERDKRIGVFFMGKKIGVYVPDLIIKESILIELKAKPKLTREDEKQFWHYLRNTNYKVGFLINFGVSDGVEIIRKVYDTARK